MIRIEQVGLDRILHLVFESVNEMGDLVELTLVVEIMGRHSNIVLVDHSGRIIDAIKRIDAEMSSVRADPSGDALSIASAAGGKAGPAEYQTRPGCRNGWRRPVAGKFPRLCCRQCRACPL